MKQPYVPVYPLCCLIPFDPAARPAYDLLVEVLMNQAVPVMLFPARVRDARLAGVRLTDEDLDKVPLLAPFWLQYRNLVLTVSPRVLSYMPAPDLLHILQQARRRRAYMAYSFRGVARRDALLWRGKYAGDLTRPLIEQERLEVLLEGRWMSTPQAIADGAAALEWS